MSPDEIAAYARPSVGAAGALEQARRAMVSTGQWSPGQNMGRSWPIGCVALEITQRCNLDCTLCYLSEISEATKDVPLAEVFRRIDMIAAEYGAGTNVQVTGGEPTLRRKDELLAIVRRLHAKGLRPALFTNGIRATRTLLSELRDAGLTDVAFHVDTTQRRPGYASEADLNGLRESCIGRARGLCLAVYFNTTVHDGNFDEVPMLSEFFVRHSDAVSIASFQLQANTGRGIWGARSARIGLESVARQINKGAGANLDFNAMRVGHSRCNRHAMGLVVGGKVFDALDDSAFVHWILPKMAGLQLDRARRGKSLRILCSWSLRHPDVLARALPWIGRKVWQARRELVRARGSVHKLSFFIHNFMDACSLERERIDACVFTVASGEAPQPMCLYNARRDQELRRPVRVSGESRVGFWNPLTGRIEPDIPVGLGVRHTRKTARGRAKLAV